MYFALSYDSVCRIGVIDSFCRSQPFKMLRWCKFPEQTKFINTSEFPAELTLFWILLKLSVIRFLARSFTDSVSTHKRLEKSNTPSKNICFSDVSLFQCKLPAFECKLLTARPSLNHFFRHFKTMLYFFQRLNLQWSSINHLLQKGYSRTQVNTLISM